MDKNRPLKELLDVCKKIEEWILVICLIVMGGILVAQILLRYIFHSPISWAEELARYLQIWITFLGMGYAFRKKGHISLDIVLSKLPPMLRCVTEIFNDVVMIACALLIIISAPEFLLQQNKLSSTLHVPMYLVYAVIPVGFGITILYLIADIIQKIRHNITGGEPKL